MGDGDDIGYGAFAFDEFGQVFDKQGHVAVEEGEKLPVDGILVSFCVGAS